MVIFLDTSSVVKLYANETGAEAVRALVGRADLVATSAMTYPEARAALARSRREKLLTAADYALIKRRFDQEWSTFLSIAVTDSLAEAAGGLAEQHGLRGCDAIQLATFVQLLQGCDDDEIEFSSFDERLSKAARNLD